MLEDVIENLPSNEGVSNVPDQDGIDISLTQEKQSPEEAEERKTVAEKIHEMAKAKSASNSEEKEVSKPDLPSTEQKPSEEYKASYTYTAYDKNYEMPEWSKSLIKDKATEENFRQLFSKAEAFEPLKSKHEELRKSYDADNQKWSTVMGRLEEAQFYLDKNDLGSFFQRINVPVEQVLDFVRGYIKYHEMPVDQRSIIDQNRELNRQTFQMQNSLLLSQQQQAQLAANQREFEVQKVMSLPEVSKFQKMFDAKLGEGAFKKHTDSYSEQVWLKSGKTTTPSPLETTQYVMNQYKALFEAPVSEQSMESSPKGVTKPGGVIPNVGRGMPAVSPVKKRFTSLEALRKHAKEIVKEEATG